MDAVVQLMEPGAEADAAPSRPRRGAPEPWSELFAAVAAGDRDALGRLYDAAADRLYGLALWTTRSPEDAADVVAEVWIRIAQHPARLADVRSPRAWLLTVTRRIALDLVRRRRGSEPIESAALLEDPADPPDRAADAERASALVASLPVAQREVVYLRHFAGCTFTEIGRIAGVPRFTAASRYRLAIRRLRRMLEVEP